MITPRNRFLFLWVVTVVGLGALALGADIAPTQMGGQPRVDATLDRTAVFEGESVQYTVMLVNCPEDAKPGVAAMADFHVTYIGAGGRSQYQSFMNGRVTREIRIPHVYMLQPKKAGVLTVPSATVTIGGKTLSSPTRTLRVKAIVAQDAVILETSSSKTEVFRQEPFTLRLDIFVRDLPAPHDNTNPLTVQQRNDKPNLGLNWIEIPNGLLAPPANSWLSQYVDRTGRGFTINHTRRRDEFMSLFNNVNSFLPEATRVKRKGLSGTMLGYHRYRIERRFKPVKAGVYNFGPATLKGLFATEVVMEKTRFGRERPRLTGDTYFARSEGLTVTVLDPPDEQRPATYTGGVGRFKVWATAAPKKLRVGDPLTVTIYVQGATGLEDVGALKLAEQPAIIERFKVYEDQPTGEVKDGRKVFVHSLRPLSAEVTEVPPIELSYFDVDKERYETVKTAPLPLDVETAEKMNLSDVLVTNGPRGATDLVERAEGIFANVTDVTRLSDQRLNPLFWFGGVGAIGAFYLLLAMFVGITRRRNADPAAVRRRGAFVRGQEALGRASKASGAEALAGVKAAFAEVVASLRNVPAEGLTARDVADFSRDLGDEALGDALLDTLERCEAAQFGAGAADSPAVSAAIEEARGLLGRLQALYRKEGRTTADPGSRIVSLLPWIVVASVAVGASGASTGSAQSRVAVDFVAAQNRYDQAKSPEDFLRAAAMFRAIIDGGYEDGVVFYNLGNAYYRGGELGHAIAAYRQAKRHLPRDDHLDANLRQALSRRVDRFVDPGPSLIDHIFFWTGSLGYRTQFQLMLSVAALAWLIAIVRLLSPRFAGLRWAIVMTVVATVLVAAGCGLTYYRTDVIVNGVVTADKVMTLKAPNGSAAYDKPIHEGTEFVLLEERGPRARAGWLRIRFAAGREGWIPAASGITY